MSIGMSWGAPEHGQAWGEFSSVDECARALDRSLRRVLGRMAPGMRGCLLKRSVHRLRADMCTQGLHHVSQGHSWHGEAGTVWVSLYPHGGGKHEKAPHRPVIGR